MGNTFPFRALDIMQATFTFLVKMLWKEIVMRVMWAHGIHLCIILVVSSPRKATCWVFSSKDRWIQLGSNKYNQNTKKILIF